MTTFVFSLLSIFYIMARTFARLFQKFQGLEPKGPMHRYLFSTLSGCYLPPFLMKLF